MHPLPKNMSRTSTDATDKTQCFARSLHIFFPSRCTRPGAAWKLHVPGYTVTNYGGDGRHARSGEGGVAPPNTSLTTNTQHHLENTCETVFLHQTHRAEIQIRKTHGPQDKNNAAPRHRARERETLIAVLCRSVFVVQVTLHESKSRSPLRILSEQLNLVLKQWECTSFARGV